MSDPGPIPAASAPRGWPGLLAMAAARAMLATGAALLFWALAPALIGWMGAVVQSGSMRPSLSPGDAVIYDRPVVADLRPGQVVLVDAEDELLTHRLVSVDRGMLLTKGDANGAADRQLAATALQGRARLVVPLVGLPQVWVAHGQWVRVALLAGLGAGLLILAVPPGSAPGSRGPGSGGQRQRLDEAVRRARARLLPAADAPVPFDTARTMLGLGGLSAAALLMAGVTPTEAAFAASTSTAGTFRAAPATAPPRYVNFQPANVAAVAGYDVDSGLAYGPRGAGLTYGWNAANNETRARNAPADRRLATLNHMQKPSNPNAAWEIAVPAGSYRVRISGGDNDFSDSVLKIAAEGVLVVSGTPSTANRFVEGTATVTVNDGRLTVTSAAGASNNKINYIDITPL